MRLSSFCCDSIGQVTCLLFAPDLVVGIEKGGPSRPHSVDRTGEEPINTVRDFRVLT